MNIREKVPVRTYNKKELSHYRYYKKYLEIDFENKCCYCNDSDNYSDAYHVEHFAPKSKFPDLTNKYDNLLYCCPYCNRSKSDKWISNDSQVSVADEKGFIDPCNFDYDLHFERTSDGRINAITKLGEYMHKELSLGLVRHSILYRIALINKSVDKLNEKLSECHEEDKKRKIENALKLVKSEFYDYYHLLKPRKS